MPNGNLLALAVQQQPQQEEESPLRVFSSLKFQKPSLSPQTSTIPCETSVTADNPVTRDDDADPIIAVGTRDGAKRLWCTDSRGNIPVACCFSMRNSS